MVRFPEILVPIFFGWPAVIASLILSLAGLVWKRFWLLLAGTAILLPFSFFLSGSPLLRGWAFALPAFLVGSAFMLRARKDAAAWLLASPTFLGIVILVITILTYATLMRGNGD